MRRFFILLLALSFMSCEKYDLETAYFHKTNLELEFNLDEPDNNGGCDCFIYLCNNYQSIIDNIIITYEIQDENGNSVKDYITNSSINMVKIRSTTPFYVGEGYWTVISDMVYNSKARYLKILDIKINYFK